MLRRLATTLSFATAVALLGACEVNAGAPTATLDAPLGTSAPLAPHTAAACQHPARDDCSFYRSCLESSRPCGDDGYALAYGERLCYAFIEQRGSFSIEGQRWLGGVRSCLQEALVPMLHEPGSCRALLDDAYATHPDCYTAADNSICSLPAGDVLELASILGEDLFSARALAQMRDVAHTCVLELFGFAPTREWNASRHEFFRALETAASSDVALRTFVAKTRAETRAE
jgi:hypothetical protein